MGYTIIGQNNSVTTIDDGNGHTLHIPSRVALAIGTTFTIVEVNNNMATLEDSNGKVYRDIPCVVDLVGSGGGGGSSLPDQTGHAGEFLTTDGTDTSWAAVTKVNTTVTIAAADWNGGTTVTKTVAGITATGVVFVSPDPTDQADYTSAGILCTAQAAGTLTFTCSTTPTNAITVNVVAL